ncbi:unnamed protein product [Cuscuta epithymum]|uniref:Uncharacterized protein n=2 Tax=Cuscuta epithymum TaxID=186058 RepID=A0AAV0G461_9ASTE|nr:unnamed protein product [Cuscuta epithymum]
MSDCFQRKIEVRSLSGEKTSASVSSDLTVQQLKLILKQTFVPASSSPNFHLFFKGTKLALENRLSSYSLGDGDFLVLVPFAKKDRDKSDQSAALSDVSGSATSKQSESTWADTVEDLSVLSSAFSCKNQNDVELEINLKKCKNSNISSCSSQRKRKLNSQDKKTQVPTEEFIFDILQSSNSSIDEQTSKFVMILDSVNCLTDPSSGNCICIEARRQNSDMDPCSGKNKLCMCPSWLKNKMKLFSFINVYYAVIQLQSGEVTVYSLKRALDKLGKFGFQASIVDVEHLTDLCAKVITIVDDYHVIMNSTNRIVILKTSTEERDQHDDAKKSISQSKIVNSMKRRQECFNTSVMKALRSFVLEDGINFSNLSLEDFILYVNQCSEKKGKPSDSHSFKALCHDTNPMLPVEMLEHLRRCIGSKGQVVHVEEINARNATYVEIPSELSELTKVALKNIGITRLYSHQAESVQASLAGKDVVVATLTSSGKSLCYNLPVLEVLSYNSLACAIYLFPTKALAQDQLRALLAMTNELDHNINIGVYDGDTSLSDRTWQRENSRLMITNPDMLHMSILPFHGQFRRIFSNLRFIILDEAHAYKGAFGCHTALILRRLRRLCSHVYGSNPSFIFSTATSANPADHTKELANLPAIELIQNDGSPSGPKTFVLWNPPVCLRTVSKRSKKGTNAINSTDGYRSVVVGRSSPMLEVSYIFAEMVQHGLRCIAFCKTRKLCELVLSYTREILQESAPHLVDVICAYRAGYVAEDRRRIEHDLFSGKMCGIAATNALELGIDVGHIDVTLHLGFPGSIASLWQQAGRSGRRGNPSIAIYVAFGGPLDQYFMKLPNKLFKSPVECCHIDANNPQVLEQHLACAAFEHPLSLHHDEKYFGPGLEAAVMTLKDKGYLSTDVSHDCSARIWSYIGPEKVPSNAVNVRAIETGRYQVIDKQKNELLEEIEESRAFFQVYEGAVYLNQGKTYLVKEMDLSSKIAWCQEADLKYYTKTRDLTDIHITGGNIAYPARNLNVPFARTTARAQFCRVTTTWFGFRRLWKKSNQVFDTLELSLPNYSYESQAVWVPVSVMIKKTVEALNYSFRGGLHAACHAVLHVVPLFVICNTSDIASECVNPNDSRYVPERILLYDPRPGGTGIAAQMQPLFTELLTAALELLTSCHCSGDAGCPNCVQNTICEEYNEFLHKDAAIIILKGVIQAEQV